MNPELQSDTAWTFAAVGIVTAILSPIAWVFRKLFGRIAEAEALAYSLDTKLTAKIDANAETGRKDRDALRVEITERLDRMQETMATRQDIESLNTTMKLLVSVLSGRTA